MTSLDDCKDGDFKSGVSVDKSLVATPATDLSNNEQNRNTRENNSPVTSRNPDIIVSSTVGAKTLHCSLDSRSGNDSGGLSTFEGIHASPCYKSDSGGSRAVEDVSSQTEDNALHGNKQNTLQKGDLVHIAEMGGPGVRPRHGGLGRILGVHSPKAKHDTTAGRHGVKPAPIGYDVEYILGGRLYNIPLHDLTLTTAVAEGFEEEPRGKELRKEKYHTSRPSRKRRAANRLPDVDGPENENDTKSAEFDRRNKENMSLLSGNSTTNKRKRDSVEDINCGNGTNSNPRHLVGKNKSKLAKGGSTKRGGRRNSSLNPNESDAITRVDEERLLNSKDMYYRHRKEFERSLVRLEKADRFGFFLDQPPPCYDERYEVEDDSHEPECGPEHEKHEVEKQNDEMAKGNDSGDNRGAKWKKNSFVFPDHPPFNFIVLRKRLAAGRYDLDRIAVEAKRINDIQSMLKSNDISGNCVTSPVHVARDTQGSSIVERKCNESDVYTDLSRSMRHPVGVDWDTLLSDVVGMCNAAIGRDPDGPSLGSGHLGFAATKIKRVMEEMYDRYGSRRKVEMDRDEARHKFENILLSCGNQEAAMQGEWRKNAFPERKYERLEAMSVICDGLSEMDKSYAIYELGTSIPDSFVGLAYTYHDSGQQSETWMKTVADETNQAVSQVSKNRRKNREASEPASNAGKEKNKARKAAIALAKDDGVIRAQVCTTMSSLLIQVQDRVMTDLGVMHHAEKRSANWDDGDHRRHYRGGGAEVEQGSRPTTSPKSDVTNETVSLLPEVAEQPVWGIDCYTRKNITAVIESEFTPQVAVEFVEKWLLPAINACPVNLAHDICYAAKILEGSQLLLDDVSSYQSIQTDDCKPPEDFPQTGTYGVKPQSPTSPENRVFLSVALASKIKFQCPPWLRAVAGLLRRAAESLGPDFFRIHPKGHGSVVISEHGLKANSLVTYYRGEVFPAWRWCEKLDAIEQTQTRLRLRPNLSDFYNMVMERPIKDPRGYGILFVDASRKAGLGSSFSHSCDPTCEVRVVALNGRLSLSMTTLRDLERGEELTFDYNAVTESLDEYRSAVCLCGHRNCRGSFLHFATADCYQQVLSRNSPIAVRFANLARGSMKQVMSKEDSELLLKHGFNTAAFGAVSFNHHIDSSDEPETPDSIENVPVWLRTFVADTLRYIEYERRALPVALLCNQMEKMEKEQKQLSLLPTKDNRSKKTLPDRKKLQPEKILSSEISPEKLKPIPGSKPQPSYFYFVSSQKDHFASIAEAEAGEKLHGLELSRSVNKVASRAWNGLCDDVKQAWKQKALEDWENNGGRAKAKLEEERRRAIQRMQLNSGYSSEKVKRDHEGVCERDYEDVTGRRGERYEAISIEKKNITFEAADAEGWSAMEQRIQQLAQSLSRVGRVLDRHREIVYANQKISLISPGVLQNLVPSPLSIMSDEEVVNWLWNDDKGVVSNLILMIKQSFPKESHLRDSVSKIRRRYRSLTSFSLKSKPSNDTDEGNMCTSPTEARTLVRDALLEFRAAILDFLSLAEESYLVNRRNNERDRGHSNRENRKKKRRKERVNEVSHSVPVEPRSFCIGNESGTLNVNSHISEGDSPNSTNEASIPPADIRTDEVLRITGGGGCLFSGVLSNESTNSLLPQHDIGTKTRILSKNESSRTETYANKPEEPRSQTSCCEVIKPVAKSNHNGNVNSKCNQGDVGDISNADRNLNHADVFILSADESGNPYENSSREVNEQSCSVMSKELLLNHREQDSSTQETSSVTTPPSFSAQGSRNMALLTRNEKINGHCLSKQAKQDLIGKLLKSQHEPKPCATEGVKLELSEGATTNETVAGNWRRRKQKRINTSGAIQSNKIRLTKTDSDHWLSFRKDRYKLEATADLLLMYAQTSTFFLLKPFSSFNSTPIEVHAREIGNDVPRSIAPFAAKRSNKIEPIGGTICSDDRNHESEQANDVDREGFSCASKNQTCTQTLTMLDKDASATGFLSPDDVVATVTVEYSGEYVLSQLLQWFNGGIGQKPGLPNIYGCVMLPPISGCWQGIREPREIRRPNYSRSYPASTTEYEAEVRPRLVNWMNDRFQRGTPWENDLARYFCPSAETNSPDPTMPMGSPVLDFLVTGNIENVQLVSGALSGDGAESENTTGHVDSNQSASDRLKSTVDEGMPAQAIANWVQCENPKCLKWRKLPWHVDIDMLPEQFFCNDNIWNSASNSCSAPEDAWDMDDAPVKFDTNDTFDIGAWYDVQREGKIGYCEAQVVEVDLSSAVKRVKFHFYKVRSELDEWIEVGSPRIAPHYSYTSAPSGGKITEKKAKHYHGSLKKKKKKKPSAVLRDIKPPNARANVNKTGQPILPSKKQKLDDSKIINGLPKLRSSPVVESSVKQNSSNSLGASLDKFTKESFQADSKTYRKSSKFPPKTIDYLNAWMSEHSTDPFPSSDEKANIMAATGLERKQLCDWLVKARKKLKAKVGDLTNTKPNVDNRYSLGMEKSLSVSTAAICVGSSNPTQQESPHATIEGLSCSNPKPLDGEERHVKGIVIPGTQQQNNLLSPSPDVVGFKEKSLLMDVNHQRQMKEEMKNPEMNVVLQLGTSSMKHAPAADTKMGSCQYHLSSCDPQTLSLPTDTNPSPTRHDNLHNEGGADEHQILVIDHASTSAATGTDIQASDQDQKARNIILSINNCQSKQNLGNRNVRTTVFSSEIKSYLWKWLTSPAHSINPYPSKAEKEKIMLDTGITDRRKLERWLSRARKKMKEKNKAIVDSSFDDPSNRTSLIDTPTYAPIAHRNGKSKEDKASPRSQTPSVPHHPEKNMNIENNNVSEEKQIEPQYSVVHPQPDNSITGLDPGDIKAHDPKEHSLCSSKFPEELKQSKTSHEYLDSRMSDPPNKSKLLLSSENSIFSNLDVARSCLRNQFGHGDIKKQDEIEVKKLPLDNSQTQGQSCGGNRITLGSPSTRQYFDVTTEYLKTPKQETETNCSDLLQRSVYVPSRNQISGSDNLSQEKNESFSGNDHRSQITTENDKLEERDFEHCGPVVVQHSGNSSAQSHVSGRPHQEHQETCSGWQRQSTPPSGYQRPKEHGSQKNYPDVSRRCANVEAKHASTKKNLVSVQRLESLTSKKQCPQTVTKTPGPKMVVEDHPVISSHSDRNLRDVAAKRSQDLNLFNTAPSQKQLESPYSELSSLCHKQHERRGEMFISTVSVSPVDGLPKTQDHAHIGAKYQYRPLLDSQQFHLFSPEIHKSNGDTFMYQHYITPRPRPSSTLSLEKARKKVPPAIPLKKTEANLLVLSHNEPQTTNECKHAGMRLPEAPHHSLSPINAKPIKHGVVWSRNFGQAKCISHGGGFHSISLPHHASISIPPKKTFRSDTSASRQFSAVQDATASEKTPHSSPHHQIVPYPFGVGLCTHKYKPPHQTVDIIGPRIVENVTTDKVDLNKSVIDSPNKLHDNPCHFHKPSEKDFPHSFLHGEAFSSSNYPQR